MLFSSLAFAQKKPLDYSVYDQWQSVATRQITHNGKWTSYSINPQEGDNTLYLQKTDNSKKIAIPRASQLQFTQDSKFAVALIKPFYKDTKAVKDKNKTLTAFLLGGLADEFNKMLADGK